MMRLAAALCFVLAACASAPGAGARDPQTLDAFESAAPWATQPSDGVSAALSQTPGATGQAVRMSFDFNGGAGYAAMRRPLALRDLPENYELSFMIRGQARENTFEVKFADESGENVWWSVRRNYVVPREWTRVTIRKRQIEFAWGPAGDRAFRGAAAIEFVMTAGQGGAGFIEIDDLAIRALPAPPATPPAIAARASAGEAAAAVDEDRATAWRADAGARLTLDLGYAREFGGIVLRWAEGAHATRYDLAVSNDGRAWRDAARVTDGDGATDAFRLPDSEARYVRLSLHDAGALEEAEIRDLVFGATPTAFLQALARESPRGAYPRGMHGEQSYWTLVGVDGGGPRSALMGEDAALELGRGGPSIEPFVITDGRTISWADVAVTQSLRDDYLPIPSVVWRGEGWRLETTAFAEGESAAPRLLHRYTLTNTSDRARTLTLAAAVRPLQVNPPQQFLNTPGGFSPIRTIAVADGRVEINGVARIYALRAPNAVRAAAFDSGDWIAASPGAPSAASEDGYAAAALLYTLTLAPGASETFAFVSSLTNEPVAAPRSASAGWFAAREEAAAAAWRAMAAGVAITAPPSGARVINTLRTSIATMLMSRDGPALQPGTRSYARSWIRDGAMMAEGLLRVGLDEPARAYLAWYAPYQFESGKVPCCVDARGADPVPENDSHGELIHLAALVHRYSADAEALAAAWPHVVRAADYMERLRQSERTPANQTPERRALYGLMPPSISHEGYSARPAYSYWDNFWSLRGYADAVYLARARGDAAAAQRFETQRAAFERDLLASIRLAAQRFDIDYIAGAADLGDFDATSTTIALAPGGAQHILPQDLLANTFERYWTNFETRRASQTWNDYTPYELRVVGAFVRLGRRDRAQAALDFFFSDQRPAAWGQWAEVVGREARTPRFVGDMPHGWIASDYLRSALDMFAYERAHDDALVLAAGLTDAWFEGEGVAIDGLRTPYGVLRYAMRKQGRDYLVAIGGDARPPGGFVLAPPLPPGAAICLNGRRVSEARLAGASERVRVGPCAAGAR